MKTVSFEKGNVRMIAHRGLSGLEQENTAAAFVAAGNRSHFGIETDVHVTADGKFVIIHDDDTSRVTDEKLSVEGSTEETLRQLTLFDKRSNVKRGDLKIPTLSEYLSICVRYGKVAVIELKNRMKKQYIEEIYTLVKDMGWVDSSIFISFSDDNLVDLRAIAPSVKAQFLTGKADSKVLKFLEKYNLDLDVFEGSVDRKLVDAVHGIGKKVNCWTVDDPMRAEELVSFGVDFITSNILE